MNKKGLTGALIAEVFGTFILILLGVGVVANVGLAPRTAASTYNWNTIAIGWCFAVIIAVYVTGGVSAHLNPAVTLAMAAKRGFPWANVVPYIIAQMIGAFLGAFAVYLVYREGMIAAGLPNIYTSGAGSVFEAAYWGDSAPRTALGSYSLFNASVAEFFGTCILLWAVLASGDSRNLGLKHNLGNFLVGFAVLAVGLSLSGPSGYSINPARDLGPRLFGLLAGTQNLFDGLYWLIPPVLVPAVAGPAAIFMYDWFISPFLPEKAA
jgi:glycerol uptake facilitator protein